jgi:S1-C subfamily serine protease
MTRNGAVWAAAVLAIAGMGGREVAAQEAAAVVVYPPPGPAPRPMLGVNVDVAYVWNPATGWETGVRIVNVWPGMPAAGRLDPGDIVTRVNGVRTYNVFDFQQAIAQSGGVVNLRLRDVRTGWIVDYPPIWLNGGGGGVFAAPAAAALAQDAP